MKEQDLGIPIPADWPENVTSALRSVADLAFRAITRTRSECINSRNSRVQLAGNLERTRGEVIQPRSRASHTKGQDERQEYGVRMSPSSHSIVCS